MIVLEISTSLLIAVPLMVTCSLISFLRLMILGVSTSSVGSVAVISISFCCISIGISPLAFGPLTFFPPSVDVYTVVVLLPPFFVPPAVPSSFVPPPPVLPAPPLPVPDHPAPEISLVIVVFVSILTSKLIVISLSVGTSAFTDPILQFARSIDNVVNFGSGVVTSLFKILMNPSAILAAMR